VQLGKTSKERSRRLREPDEEVVLLIDETGDEKKGKTTDYVARQYIGNLGKTENGIVSVNSYAIVEGITYPLN
jgi:SRSO17 transposase